MRSGEPATVTVDTYPNVLWHGTVQSVSPAAAQEFSLLPAQNASGNWVKVVQRVQLRIRQDTTDQRMPPLSAGMSAEVDVDTGHPRGVPHFLSERLDWFGFGTLSIAIGALQILLDRGETKDWFSSGEIVIEAVVACVAFYLFLVHTFTTKRPFMPPRLFRDRNLVAGTIFIAIVGLTYYASMALQPPYFQGLMNYPVLTSGLVMGPRGLGSMIAMLVVGRLMGRLDTRVLLALGLGLNAWSFYAMTGWTPDVSMAEIVIVTIVQGVGLGFLFVPLSAVALATLSAEDRTSGAGVFNLTRNIGSSVGIAVVNALITRNTQVNHAQLSQYITAANRALESPSVAHFWDPLTAGGRATLDAVITRQAQIIAYVDDYKLLFLACVAAIPLLVIFKRSSAAGAEHVVVAD